MLLLFKILINTSQIEIYFVENKTSDLTNVFVNFNFYYNFFEYYKRIILLD